MTKPQEPTLAEFVAWCNGAGRGGANAGKHYQALNAVKSFREFKQRQHELAVEALQERTR